MLLVFSLVLGATAITLYFVDSFTLLYLIVASLSSVILVYACARLVISGAYQDAWRLHKAIGFPVSGFNSLPYV